MKNFNSRPLHNQADATLFVNRATRQQDLNWKEYLPMVLLGVMLLGLLMHGLLW
ncbi:MAG: hypothetical protein GW921_04450 [Gallionella sp.]|nr:hypothetical protein [Gallionella sp.]